MYEFNSRRLGEWLRHKRMAQRLTLRQLADTCDLTYQRIQQMEAPRRNSMSMSTFMEAARIYGADPVEMMEVAVGRPRTRSDEQQLLNKIIAMNLSSRQIALISNMLDAIRETSDMGSQRRKKSS